MGFRSADVSVRVRKVDQKDGERLRGKTLRKCPEMGYKSEVENEGFR